MRNIIFVNIKCSGRRGEKAFQWYRTLESYKKVKTGLRIFKSQPIVPHIRAFIQNNDRVMNNKVIL